MIEYPKEFYYYLNKAYEDGLSNEERQYYLDLADKIAKPIEDALERDGLVA